MKPPLRCLIVEDSEDDALFLLRELQRAYRPEYRRVETESAMTAALDDQTWDIVLSDYSMPYFSGVAALKLLRARNPDLPFLLISGAIGEEAAVEVMKAGAQDYVPKGKLSRLLPAIERELRDAEMRREHRKAQEQIHRQFARLTALRAIDVAINSSADLRLTLNLLVAQVVALLGVDAADVLLLNRQTHVLEYVVATGFRNPANTRGHVRLGQGLVGRAALERSRVVEPNLAEAESFTRSKLVTEEGFAAYYAVPLVAKGQIKGVLEGFHRARTEVDADWLEFLETLAGQAAIAIDNAQMMRDLQQSNEELIIAYDTTLEGWVKALDLRDKETEGHSQRVTEMTLRLAQAMGMREEEMQHVRRGALLHDIGKLGIADDILLKPSSLTPEEWVTMRRHTEYAYEWLSAIPYLRPALDIPYCHHERWDGSGYPRGLKGEQIPLAARIFSVVDVWDALRSNRPYRSAWPETKVREHILSLAGKQFDPTVVQGFFEMLASGQIGGLRGPDSVTV